MDGVLAEIRIWAANLAPRGWMLRQGQSLSIAQYSARYSLLGTTHGGDGVSVVQPSLGVNDIICVEGIYPSRG